jgi:hypothetical protein
METPRRSPRLAAKVLAEKEPFVPLLELHKLNISKKQEPRQKKIEGVVYQKHDQTYLFINFIVHGLMKYEINDPKADEMREKTTAFLQLAVFFVLIKSVLWYCGYLYI